jgi:alanine racemase
MLRPTRAIIDLNALEQNVRGIKAELYPQTLLLAVVKADSYGHGAPQIARRALESGANWLGVALPEEGAQLRQAGLTAPILVLGAILPGSVDDVLDNDLRQTVFTSEQVQALEERADFAGKSVKIHVKIDTGMNRLGVKTSEELDQLLDTIAACPHVELEGVFTHFCTSDERDKEFTREQVSRFEGAVERIRARGYHPLLHAANSASAIELVEYQYDMVRAGIALYGCYPSEEVSRDVKLTPVMRLVSAVMHVKTIKAGETVSYNRTFQAPQDMRVATVPVGYGDGYKRLLSNRGEMLVRGKRAKIIGRICMDQTMIDVTDIEDVQVGDEVVLIGSQGQECIAAEEVAKWSETISYEVLCSLSDRIPRIYVDGTN